MKVNIKGKELDLHYSMRIYLIYETITGKTLSLETGSYTVSVNLFYSAILASMQHANLDLNFEYDEYLDWLDTQGMDLIKEFIEWFLKIMNVNSSLVEKQIDEKDIKNTNTERQKKA